MDINRCYPCDGRNYTRGRTQKVAFLVLHYVGAFGSAKNNAQYYGSSDVGASAHYFVGHKSSHAAIYQSVPEGSTAWHVGGNKGYKHPNCRNANSIGIELCCHQDKKGVWYFDAETVDNAVKLARDIVGRYKIPAENVLRHYDVTGKICPAPFVWDGKAWEAFKKRVYETEGEIDMTKEEMQKLVAETVAKELPAAVTKELAERDEIAAKAAQNVSSWAKDAWGIMTAKGVFDGTRPGGMLTREQAATVICRLQSGEKDKAN